MKENNPYYRPDIDGLRAFSVLVVLLFHAGVDVFSGGFVGVDVFFVISGYLITSIIFIEIRDGRFSFLSFYQRRVARIIPAVLITLLLVIFLGFFLSPPDEYLNLGKDIVYSSIGAMNILLARGVDYFAPQGNVQPLVHFWSLGVEEQFYVLWPVILLLTIRFGLRTILVISGLLLVASLAASVWAIESFSKGSYYLLQYRAFELLFGCILALIIHAGHLPFISNAWQKVVTLSAVLFLVVPVFVLDADSKFPGFNALWPCIGAALLLAFPGKGLSFRLFSSQPLVAVGLISYPLYLYHQPVLAFYSNNIVTTSPFKSLMLVLIICIPLAWLTWALVERPVRRLTRSGSKIALLVFTLLILSVPAMAAFGNYIYKSDGLPMRFHSLNPFASEMIVARSHTFRPTFKSGFRVRVNESPEARALFLGDSTMQQYAVPISRSLGLEPGEIDTVTAGGCHLLKGVYLEDSYTSYCNDIRPRVYALDKQWDTVVISQHWRDGLNETKEAQTQVGAAADLENWTPYISATIKHFSALGANIILIGDHPYSSGTKNMKANIFTNKDTYANKRDSMSITNLEQMQSSRAYFGAYAQFENVTVIHPVDIVCANDCIAHDGEWAYFRDRLHFSAAATDFIIEALNDLLEGEYSKR